MKLEDVLGKELYEQVSAKITEQNANETDKTKHVRFVDLSEGGYVSKNKFDDTVNGLRQNVTDLQGQVTQRDADLTSLQNQLTAAQADAAKITDVQAALTGLQAQYEQERNDWTAKAQRQQYEFAVKTETGKLKFSSAAAQREFMREALAKNFQMDGENVLGFNDFVNSYKQNDPTAFASETKPKTDPAPAIVLPAGNTQNNPKSEFGFHFQGVRAKPES